MDKKIQLIHWDKEGSSHYASVLESEGYVVAYETPTGIEFLRSLRETMPSAVVIDLSRLPSQGRDFAFGIRAQKSTRFIPLVFVGGDPEKVRHIQEKLPDAVYTSWNCIDRILKQAIANPPKEPIAPKSIMDGYGGQPLVKKLGIKAKMVVGLVNPPSEFFTIIGDLPAGATFQVGIQNGCDTLIWFIRASDELNQSIIKVVDQRNFRFLWYAWPKKASGIHTDLTQQVIRDACLAIGLVDFKICSINETWSGLLFTWRKV